MCFGLNRDTRLKSGQIAHLDKNNSNHAEGNLAFLCFDHHDEYDSTSSQRKNFTAGEVKSFRDELYGTINKAFTQQVHFGEITTPPTDPYAGSYIRVDCGTNSAELRLTPLPDSYEGQAQYYVSGQAIWGAEREYGPNIGILEAVASMNDNGEIRYERATYSGETAVTRMKFDGDGRLDVTEENTLGQYGMNVYFDGLYEKAE